ncbi:MAG: phosphate ABC transporter permease PstA [Nocardioidaceae bacterium]|nr:phosphate ABC transporter permease PstA [Nocardioidaceae bacterium]MCL2613501.1 phosphate ABC transporter permease PstA [Nocardioidaceae bacterium]
MSVTTAPTGGISLQGNRLPRFAPYVVVVGAVALGALVTMLLGLSWVAAPVLAVIVVDIALPLWSRLVEGRRAAANRGVTCLVWTALGCTLVPLVWVLAEVVIKGAPGINAHLLTHDGTPYFDPKTLVTTAGGGAFHALVGTLMVTLCAVIISVPVGLMTAVYLVEYARGSWLARGVTLMVDVMTGIPSIVAGLFAVALFTLADPSLRMGIMGSVALSLLMIPTVVRSAEEMMRLVPNDLREAAYALGVPKWRTVLKVVLRTSLGGIITGVMLAVSRVIGETAPLLVAIGSIDETNWNPFSGRMETLPVFIMDNYTQGATTPDGYKWAWSGALLLIAIVMVLNLIARIIGKIFAPKTGR